MTKAPAEPTSMIDVFMDEGREAEVISYQVVRRACGGEPPTLDRLLKSVARGTLDGVLESALHLHPQDYAILADAHKRETAKGPNLPKTRRRKS